MPHRIALSITDLDVGGAERALTDLVTRLDRRRFHPVVYCLAARPHSEEASCAPTARARRHRGPFPGRTGPRQLPEVVRSLAALLREQGAELLQSFLFHANLVGRSAGRRAGVGCIVCGIRVAERQARWHLWLDRLTQRRVDRYVCVSQAVADFSATEGRLPREKLVVIPNGIDVEPYAAAAPADLTALGVAPGRRAVTFIGRLAQQKGVGWLVEASPAWLAQVPDCDLLLVGAGPERGNLERRAAELGLASRVHFAGWRSDVPAILAASAVLVLPSEWEGMPNVVLQAMAAGRAIVAAAVEGVAELLGPAASAQCVAFGDSSALARAHHRTAHRRSCRRRAGPHESGPRPLRVLDRAHGFSL